MEFVRQSSQIRVLWIQIIRFKVHLQVQQNQTDCAILCVLIKVLVAVICDMCTILELIKYITYLQQCLL
jgi:hypothetical protein